MMREHGQPADEEAKTFAAIETEEGKRRFLQEALQESHGLDLATYEALNNRYEPKRQSVERKAERQAIILDKGVAYETAFRSFLRRGMFEGCNEIVKSANDEKVNANFTVSSETLHEAWVGNINKLDTNIYYHGTTHEFAKQNGLEFSITQSDVQRAFTRAIRIGQLQPAQTEYRLEMCMEDIFMVAKQNGFALTLSQEEKRGLITFFKALLRDGPPRDLTYNTKSAKRIVTRLHAMGVEIELPDILDREQPSDELEKLPKEKVRSYFKRLKSSSDPEAVQKGFEKLNRIMYNDFGSAVVDFESIAEFEALCKKSGVELRDIVQIKERLYIDAIHNLKLGHAQQTREDILNCIRAAGSNLTYEQVAKMDYLNETSVPVVRQFHQNSEAYVDGHPVMVRCYAERKDGPMTGKFIIGIKSDKSLELVFDATLGEHGDIGTKYDLEVLGGGWLAVNEQEKWVTIGNSSKDFGYEPRSISMRALKEAFPDYEIEEI